MPETLAKEIRQENEIKEHRNKWNSLYCRWLDHQERKSQQIYKITERLWTYQLCSYVLVINMWKLWATAMAQGVREDAALQKDLSSVPSTPVMFLCNRCNSAPGNLRPLDPKGTCIHVHTPTHRYPPPHTYFKNNNSKYFKIYVDTQIKIKITVPGTIAPSNETLRLNTLCERLVQQLWWNTSGECKQTGVQQLNIRRVNAGLVSWLSEEMCLLNLSELSLKEPYGRRRELTDWLQVFSDLYMHIRHECAWARVHTHTQIKLFTKDSI